MRSGLAAMVSINPNQRLTWGLRGLWVTLVLVCPMISSAQNLQNFEPIPGQSGLLSVERASPLPKGRLVAGFVFSKSDRPLVARSEEASIDTVFVREQTGIDLLFALGLGHKLQLGLAVPMGAVYGPELETLGNEGFAMGDVRLMGRYGLLEEPLAQVSFGLGVSLPTGDQERFYGADSPSVSPRIIFETRRGPLTFTANAGARLRTTTQRIKNMAFGQDLTYGAGSEVDLDWPWAVLLVEAMGSVPLGSEGEDAAARPLEAFLGIRIGATQGLAFTMGGAFGINPDRGVPSRRAYIALNAGPAILFGPEPVARDGSKARVGRELPDNRPPLPSWDDQDEVVTMPPPQTASAATGAIHNGPRSVRLNPPVITAQSSASQASSEDMSQSPNGAEIVSEKSNSTETIATINTRPSQMLVTKKNPDDNDGDGIPNTRDGCPEAQEDVDGFEDQDGCPDLDNDGDGITDDQDRCPLAAGLKTSNGCPNQTPPPDMDISRIVVTDDAITLPSPITFETNKAVMDAASLEALDALAALLQSREDIKFIVIEGHTSRGGTPKANTTISGKRARAVRNHLIARGVESDRLTYVGYSNTQPTIAYGKPGAFDGNRRIEFRRATPANAPYRMISQKVDGDASLRFTFVMSRPVKAENIRMDTDGNRVFMIRFMGAQMERRWVELLDPLIKRALLHPSTEIIPSGVLRIRTTSDYPNAIIDDVQVQVRGKTVVVDLPRW